MFKFTDSSLYEVVLYTDGGAVPNPGFAGHGIHGYFFVSKESKDYKESKKPVSIVNNFVITVNTDNKQEYVTPTTNGYIAFNPSQGVPKGVTAVTPAAYVDHCLSFFSPATNNVAELSASIHSFNIVLDALNAGAKISRMLMVLDSQYVLNTLETYGDAYRRNGWMTSRGEPAKNQNEIETALVLRDKILEKGVKIEYQWIKGHAGEVGNGMADYLATIAVRRSKDMNNPNQIQWSDPKDYWGADVDMHPFLSFRRSFFNRVSEFNKPGEYLLIEPASEDLMMGKRDHEAYAVVRLKEPNLYMETVREAQSKFRQDENRIIVDRMDRIRNKFIQKFIREHGHYCLGPSVNDRAVNFLDKAAVAMEHNPPALFYRVVEALGVITSRLDEFVQLTGTLEQDQSTKLDVNGLVVHEITNDFYLVEEKPNGKQGTVSKKVLKPEFVVGYKNHVIELEEERDGEKKKHKFALALGMDLPNRNALKHLEDHNPQVYLVTWKTSPDVLQYAFVIDCLTGTGMWSNYYCDRIFLKNG